MYRIRIHGRGGQGMRTASRVLGTAFFLEGFQVQDAPRYGAERRGAPINAYVRASRASVTERGIIRAPDLVIVADESLMQVASAGVLEGVDEHTLLLINTSEEPETWRRRLNVPGRIIALAGTGPLGTGEELPLAGMTCAGAAARLSGAISEEALRRAVQNELGRLGSGIVEKNLEAAQTGYESMAAHAGSVRKGREVTPESYTPPAWIDLSFEDARASAPAIHAAATSVSVKTGLWRTMRPVIDYRRCTKCWWFCSSFCPDSVISLNSEGYPVIDYDHCKGCLICAAQCGTHAIRVVPEEEVRKEGVAP
jgi:pyruvate ferredoxin oxidoreductase gamma subunit